MNTYVLVENLEGRGERLLGVYGTKELAEAQKTTYQGYFKYRYYEIQEWPLIQ